MPGPWLYLGNQLAYPRGPSWTESKINKDFKSLGFLNLKSQNFLKISKFQDFLGNWLNYQVDIVFRNKSQILDEILLNLESLVFTAIFQRFEILQIFTRILVKIWWNLLNLESRLCVADPSSLSLEIGILAQIGVLIWSASINSTQSHIRLSLCVCACAKCTLKLCMVMYNYIIMH